MDSDHSTTKGIQSTARGDRKQRYQDVMTAAATVLEERGWDEFSIRDVASRAGVSAGAVYQWFSGKGEIWANLQRDRFDADRAIVTSWPTDLSPVETVSRILDLLARSYVDLGRYRFAFVSTLKGRVPGYAIELTSAHHLLSAEIATHVVRIQDRAEPPTDQNARLSWLWATSKGVGDHLVDARHEAHGVKQDIFLETAARSVLAGLTAP
ncbi:MAG: AcrR family transcriptional regulator [Candidatus Aldehydirespiratoraceae bacterium]|jgi:AcrR family transcriptional regulator